MKYKEILKQISKKEGISTREIEKEMKCALDIAGLNCSPKEFIRITSASLGKTIYSKSYKI